MKILLFGKNGQVGWELQRSLQPLGEVVAVGRDSTSLCGDFTRPDGIAETVRSVCPDVVVNAAAYTAVDRAESEPELARAVNASGPGVLAEESNACGAWLVHYSTDYVFDGRGSTAWGENVEPSPLNVYGKTKLEGEHAVAECPRHLIFRTSWVYGTNGSNFAKTMLRLARERERLQVVGDQHGAPTGAELLADVTAHAIRAALCRPNGEALAGTYHLAAAGATTWHDYAKFVIDHARTRGEVLACKAIESIPTQAFPTPAVRPKNSLLDTQKIKTAFGLALPHWTIGVERMLDEIISRPA